MGRVVKTRLRVGRGVMLGAGLALCTVVLASCLHQGRPATLEDRMWIHFRDAADVQMALVRGDLEETHRAARRMAATGDVSGVPADAQAELEAFRQRAREVAYASTLEEAAMAGARMAAACGSCHLSADAGPVFSGEGPPPPDDDVGHMVEHLWGADRMWEGLVTPSDELWRQGARMLAQHAVPMDILAPGTSGLGVEMKALGLEALNEATPQARATRYGEILGTCAGCHAASGVTGG